MSVLTPDAWRRAGVQRNLRRCARCCSQDTRIRSSYRCHFEGDFHPQELSSLQHSTGATPSSGQVTCCSKRSPAVTGFCGLWQDDRWNHLFFFTILSVSSSILERSDRTASTQCHMFPALRESQHLLEPGDNLHSNSAPYISDLA